ncbi:carboxyl-terminal protease [Caldicellulosiruptor saccharolyticus DSM 8903]|uniref:Carboxyl-terminal protease n=1 Tax=Caldicellulosiruptor saccharolyticus (strain ATCC 43494 / DSM 8903 / Tp8T 6331) TaxID=351627 RepID=A4XLY4_CALS8|nr:S41 family peptidase [Caldicellulosiruptor saccharolyticus]ABP67919.1 carboxyl-terminal protease [Caldicellulosiruptor saccharolyticus DSM 8903]
MKKRLNTIAIILITAVATYIFTTYLYFGSPLYANNLVTNPKLSKVIWLLKKYYYEPKDISDQKLIDGAIDGIAASVNDPYTEYFTKKEFNEFVIQSKGTYFGIGVTIEPGEHYIEVVTSFEGSPAYMAGIKPGDKIIKVNGISLTAKDIDKAASLMRGPKGTPVTVTVLRDGSSKPIDFKIVRDEIKIKTVSSKIFDNTIGYIKITNFDENTPQDFMAAYDKLKSSGCRALIIDLRFNPGGLLESVVDVASNFLKKGQLIVYLKDRYNNKQYFKSYKNGDTVTPLIVLTNRYSASASEILAGCLKDQKRAKIVGEKTFGKGVVQQVFELGDGSAIKITVSQYLLPSGAYINKKGIKPDIQVLQPKEYQDKMNVPLNKDLQLKKAIEILKSSI